MKRRRNTDEKNGSVHTGHRNETQRHVPVVCELVKRGEGKNLPNEQTSQMSILVLIICPRCSLLPLCMPFSFLCESRDLK